MEKRTVGVIGSGSFGLAVSNLIAHNYDVLLYSRNEEVIKKLKRVLSNKKIMLENTSKVLKNYDKVTFSDVDYTNFEEFEKLTTISQNLIDKVLADKKLEENVEWHLTLH